ncbi:MAG: hypothetical protein JWO85_2664 [Candidatus Eremiobacteraeota bacterium]|nr:hypothetical protein [Candidatus Eremiobacteraeota bacterium]
MSEMRRRQSIAPNANSSVKAESKKRIIVPAGKTRKECEALVGDGCVSTKDAVKDLGFSRKVLERAMDAGTLPYVRIGTRRRVIPRKALRTWLAERLVLK